MRVAVCIDDNGGMLFGGRRQSRDRVLLTDLAQDAGGPVWVSPFSAPLFEAEHLPCTVNADLLSAAPETATCFVEDRELTPYLDRVETVILYRWNRVYPADVYLDIDPSDAGFSLATTGDFVGSSHDKITKEVYVK